MMYIIRRGYSPSVISPMRLYEVHVAVLGKESHQLVISPARREKEERVRGEYEDTLPLCLFKRKKVCPFNQMTVVCPGTNVICKIRVNTAFIESRERERESEEINQANERQCK